MNNPQSLKPLLLVRPAPHPCEGVPEYVQRVAKANGFRSANDLAGLLGLRLDHIVKQPVDRLLAVIQGKADSDILRLHTGNLQFPRSCGGSALRGGRVCPHCLAESDILSSDWSLPLSISCARHQTALLDRCPHCLTCIRRSDSLYRCRCGQDFKKIESPPTPSWEKQYFELFAPWRASPDLQISGADVSRLEAQVGRVIRRLIQHICPEDQDATASSVDHPLSWIQSADHPSLATICRDEKSLAETTLRLFPNFTVTAKKKYARYADVTMVQPRILLLTQQLQPARGFTVPRTLVQIREARREKSAALDRVALSFGVPSSVVSRALRFRVWQETVRTTSGEPKGADLLHCMQSCIKNTESVEDLARSLGVSQECLSVLRKYWSPRIVRLPAKYFGLWRIHKTLSEELKQAIRTTGLDELLARNHVIREGIPWLS